MTASPIARTRYDTVAATLHWLMAALVIVQLALGWTFSDMARGETRDAVFAWHRTVGFALLALALLRLGWRLGHRPPPFPTTMPAWERTLARTSHLLFYALLIALPLTGWVYVSSGGTAARTGQTTLINDIAFPILPGLPRAWHGLSATVHEWLVWGLCVLLIVHVAAALKHHVFSSPPGVGGRLPPLPRR